MSINAHRALFASHADDTYLANLTVPDGEREELRDIRDEIRRTLRTGFAEWDRHLERRQLFEAAALESFADAQPLRPKFRMQGSWSYHTLNRATVTPPQEIDLDDGVFLPISFLTRDGTTHPAVVSEAYFAAVEAMLAPLCEERGWTLSGKSSCVRVAVRLGAHVDLALYAIPDDDFRELVEKAERVALASFGARVLDEAMAFDQVVYPNLPDDHIMLAHREEGWKPSDPRKLERWFDEAVKRHGQQLRRMCRYLKGWRDHTWKGCRLSSIALMACVVAAYDAAAHSPRENRDDEALKMVADRMTTTLAGVIANPVVEGQRLDEGWDEECRSEFIAQAKALWTTLDAVARLSDPGQALATLRSTLGQFIPDDETLLEVEHAGAPGILGTGLLGGADQADEDRPAVKIGGSDRYG